MNCIEFHVSQNIILLIFLTPLRNVKTIFDSQVGHKQEPDRGCSLLPPVLANLLAVPSRTIADPLPLLLYSVGCSFKDGRAGIQMLCELQTQCRVRNYY